MRPFATISGIGGWSPGNQSAGPNGLLICACVKALSDPGTLCIVASFDSAGGVGIVAPG
jgi:hypothetical protein